jgi:two-component system sensor histidine kinase CpxA
MANVTVSDHGPGVPEEALQRLFEPFYRVSEARERASGGSGLGLAIAQKVAALHGGSIVARNREGGGLAVEILIPLHPVATGVPKGYSAT